MERSSDKYEAVKYISCTVASLFVSSFVLLEMGESVVTALLAGYIVWFVFFVSVSVSLVFVE